LNSPGYITFRGAVLAVAILILIACLVAIASGVPIYGLTFAMAVICTGLAIERRFYGANTDVRPGPGWQETSEQFIDDSTGELVRVWFNPATGQRRYVALRDDAKS
jgi:hypothetical protein